MAMTSTMTSMPQHDWDMIPTDIITTANPILSAPKMVDYAIQGKMLTASMKMSPYEAQQMDDIEMKNRLITLLVREIMDNKCIEFTKQQDFMNDEVIIRARIYVTPDADVKLIRQIQK